MQDVVQLADFPLGPIIFLVVMAGLAAVRKIVESREERSREEDAQEWSREDLPDDARRQLYGDRDIPTARAAKSRQPVGGQGQARQAQRAPARHETVESEEGRPLSMRDLMEAMVGEGEMVRRREANPPPVPDDREQARRREEERLRQQQAHAQEQARQRQTRQQALARQREAAEKKKRAAQARQQRQRAQRAPDQTSQAQRRGTARPVKAVQRPTVAETEPYGSQRVARKPVQPPVAPATGHALFGNLADVRRGIVMLEVLGQPRALRPFDEAEF